MQQWYRLGFMPIPYRSLLVKMRCQLQEPCRLNGSHISHVIFSSLYDFIVDYPRRKEKKRAIKQRGERWLTAYLDSFTHMLPEAMFTEQHERLSVVIQPLQPLSLWLCVLSTLMQPLDCLANTSSYYQHIQIEGIKAKKISLTMGPSETHNGRFGREKVSCSVVSWGSMSKHQNPRPIINHSMVTNHSMTIPGGVCLQTNKTRIRGRSRL